MGQSYLSTSLSQLIVADFRIHLFRHLQTLSLNFFAKRRTGEILSRLMNDVGVIQNLVTETPIDSAKQLVTLVGGLAFLLYMNWKLCLLIVLLLPLLVLVARLFGKPVEIPLHANTGSHRRAVHAHRRSDLGHSGREIFCPDGPGGRTLRRRG